MLILYDPRSDGAALTGGSWSAGLPLANLQDSDIRKVARTTDDTEESTQFRVTFDEPFANKAVVAGPGNFSSASKYRIRTYSDPAFETMVTDTGWVIKAERAAWNTLDWTDPSYWDGYLPTDEVGDFGQWIIHVFATPVTAQFWSIEVSDEVNPNGYIEMGRLFMGRYWAPSQNYVYGASLTLQDNSRHAQTLYGSTRHYRRQAPRVFRFGFDYLPEPEAFDDMLELMLRSGFDREVFIIPDTEAEATEMRRRSFLGNFSQMDGLTQAAFASVGTGFEIKEVI